MHRIYFGVFNIECSMFINTQPMDGTLEIGHWTFDIGYLNHSTCLIAGESL